jgi:hypothetical protein
VVRGRTQLPRCERREVGELDQRVIEIVDGIGGGALA